MFLPKTLEKIVQCLSAALVLVVHARDQLRQNPQPAVEVDRHDVGLLIHHGMVHFRDHAVPEPDAEQIEHVLSWEKVPEHGCAHKMETCALPSWHFVLCTCGSES